jgi:predicted ArsR family transcriptional regulator
MRQLEADGDIERAGVDRTGKPGRPAILYQLTEKGRNRRTWTADELAELITSAVNERRFQDVPYLLPLLRMRDKERARRLERSLVRHGYRAGDLPRGQRLPPWQPREVAAVRAASDAR